MTKPYLRDLRAAAQQLQNEIGEWVIAGVETTVPWPKISQVVEFDGLDFILRAGDEKSEASILLNAKRYGLNRKEAQDRILKLASALTWDTGSKLEVFMWLSGTRPLGIGRANGKVVQDFIDTDSLPSPADEAAWLALALFREGQSINNPFYSFLSFFKAISSIHRNGKERQKWFQETLPKIDDGLAKTRISKLAASGIDVAQYLFDEGRNAIAHAELEVFVNPDRVIDYERIQNDLPVVRSLAELAIEQRFDIYRYLSRRRKKVSAIPSFETALGDLINKIAANTPIEGTAGIDLPSSVSLVARRGAEIQAFLGMRFEELRQAPNEVRVSVIDPEQTIRFSIGLDVVKQEMQFDPLADMARVIDLTTRQGIEREINFHRFRWCIFCNGHLEVWDEEKNLQMGRTDAYMPLNMYADFERFQKEIADLEAMKQACSK